MSNNQFSALDNVKMTCQTQSIKFPSKLQLGKDMFTLAYVDLEYETRISILEIWNDYCSKMIIFPSFQLATWLNSQNTNETEFINEISHINLYMSIGNGTIAVSNRREWSFWLYFSSLHNYWHPSTWKSLVQTSWGEMNRCEKRAFQLLKMRKKEICWNKKPNA